ncbi:MAG: phosphoenolpyruvate kinase [Polyangiaceae bacterium]|nr:phosphoenolpyruvate kinase [Polyangiaceae bacterium]MCL4751456.1 phosphoenolpyruvate kinase [Myxococcales bacterium]
MSTLYDEAKDALDALAAANQRFAHDYPGDRPDRQPIHTVYGGAHLFKADTTKKLGELAVRALDTYAKDGPALTRALGLTASDDFANTIHRRVRKKLETEAVEDFRIDFEDGYGNRPEAEEDATAVGAATELARGMKAGTLPPFIGVRVKPLNDELKRRSVRTLDLFISTLVKEAGGLPDGFVVTLPKVPIPEQVTTLVRLLERIEKRTGLAPGSLQIELMVELTQSLLDREGRSTLPLLHHAAEGRLRSAHFGTYDYTASCNITAAYQAITHPACDFALHLMKVAFANTGVWLSDGATTVMPIAPHRAAKGETLSEAQLRDNERSVHAAWKLAGDNIRHALENGFYQGWDLHPAQLPVRYAATYAFFLEGFDAAANRLKNFIDKAAQATLVGDMFDDAATGQGLINYFLRGLSSGAVSLDELGSTGLTHDEIATRSFVKILAGRSKR